MWKFSRNSQFSNNSFCTYCTKAQEIFGNGFVFNRLNHIKYSTLVLQKNFFWAFVQLYLSKTCKIFFFENRKFFENSNINVAWSTYNRILKLVPLPELFSGSKNLQLFLVPTWKLAQTKKLIQVQSFWDTLLIIHTQ